MLSTRNPLHLLRYTYTEGKGWKKVFHATGKQKSSGVTTLVSDKVDYKSKTVKKDKEGHYMMIKESDNSARGYNNINIHPSELPSIYKKINTSKGIDCNTIIVGDFNTSLSEMDR